MSDKLTPSGTRFWRAIEWMMKLNALGFEDMLKSADAPDNMVKPHATDAASQLVGYGAAGRRYRARIWRAWADLIDPQGVDGLEIGEFQGQPFFADSSHEPTIDDFQKVTLAVHVSATADDELEDSMLHLEQSYKKAFLLAKERDEGSS